MLLKFIKIIEKEADLFFKHVNFIIKKIGSDGSFSSRKLSNLTEEILVECKQNNNL